MSEPRVLFVADFDSANERMARELAEGGCQLERTDGWPSARHELAQGAILLVHLSVDQLPDLHRYIWLRGARPDSRLCALVEGASELDVATALEAGADAVVVMPVEPIRLLAEVRALWRTQHGVSGSLRYGPLVVEPALRRARLNGQELPLTDAEFELLVFLARQPGTVLSRDIISQEMRGRSYDGRDRSLDLRIARLRRKLGDDPRNPNFIRSIRGEGYMFLTPG